MGETIKQVSIGMRKQNNTRCIILNQSATLITIFNLLYIIKLQFTVSIRRRYILKRSLADKVDVLWIFPTDKK